LMTEKTSISEKKKRAIVKPTKKNPKKKKLK